MQKGLISWFLCWLSGVGLVYAQANEGRYWYFGNRAGLHFGNNGVVNALYDGALATVEGCATISDAAGNLLFYTDGITVWDKQHQVMPNGFGLLGDPSATQSAVIVPAPGAPLKYYVVTVPAFPNMNVGLRYSIVDLSLNGGLGDVTIKNNLLISPVTEKVTAVRHQNQVDYWLITHEWNSNRFFVFKVDATGIVIPAVVSSVGDTHNGADFNVLGYMKLSPNGRRIAVARAFSNRVEVFNFNTQTGEVSNPYGFSYDFVNFNTEGQYGIEFSSDNTKLYVSTSGYGKIVQHNLAGGGAGPGQIIATDGAPYGLQLAPDGAIYVARLGAQDLGKIPNPNLAGAACGYIPQALHLDNGSGLHFSQIGLPTFIQSFFKPPVPELYCTNEIICEGTSRPLYCLLPPNTPIPANYHWYKDGNLVATGSDTLWASQPGKYKVVLLSDQGDTLDALPDTLTLAWAMRPLASIIKSGGQCVGDTLTLTAPIGNYQYKWFRNNTLWGNSTSLTVTENGLYTLQVIDNVTGCDSLAQIELSFVQPPSVNLLPNGTHKLCAGESIELKTTLYNNVTYEWFRDNTLIPNVNTHTFTVTESGNYAVRISTPEGCNTLSNTVTVQVFPIPLADIHVQGASAICAGTAAILSAPVYPNCIYTWTRNDTSLNLNAATIAVYLDGNYKLQITDTLSGCIGFAPGVDISVSLKPAAVLNPGTDTTLCEGQTLNLQAPMAANFSYRWFKDGLELANNTDSNFLVAEAGTYLLVVTDVNTGCDSIAPPVTISYNARPTYILSGDTQICEGDTATLQVTDSPNYQYQWWRNEQLLNVTQAILKETRGGAYRLRILDTLTGCDTLSAIWNIKLLPNPPLSFTGGNASICRGDSLRFWAGTAQTYAWYYNDSLIPDANSAVYYAKEAGTYFVVGKNGECQQISNHFDLFLKHRPKAKILFEGSATLDLGCEKVLQALPNENANYIWLKDNQYISNTPQIITQSGGVFQLILTDIYSACADTTELVLELVPFPGIPNVFTPNGDGVNDFFLPQIPCAETYSLSIFDRWGNLITTIENNARGWDGGTQAQGVYFYVFNYRTTTGLQQQRSGYVTLMR